MSLAEQVRVLNQVDEFDNSPYIIYVNLWVNNGAVLVYPQCKCVPVRSIVV